MSARKRKECEDWVKQIIDREVEKHMNGVDRPINRPISRPHVQDVTFEELEEYENMVKRIVQRKCKKFVDASQVSQAATEDDEGECFVLRADATLREFGLAVAEMYYSIRGKEWKGVPILSVLKPVTYKSHEREVEYLDEFDRLRFHMVNDSEFNKIQLSNPDFQKKEEKSNDSWLQEKNTINGLVALLISKYRRERQEIVILDHYDLRTTSWLASVNFKPEQLHVPNPDPAFLEHADREKIGLATVTCETLFDWMNRQDTEDEKLVGLFDVLADYCCTWEGRKKGKNRCRPSLDIYNMFRKTLLAKSDGVLWLTFSTRGTSSKEVVSSVTQWINKVALRFDYTLWLAFTRTYGSVVALVFITGRKHHNTDFSEFTLS